MQRASESLTAPPSATQLVSSDSPVFDDSPVSETSAAAYATAGGDDERAARMLRVSLGSARLAKRRFLDGASTDHHQKAFIGGPWAAIYRGGPNGMGGSRTANVTACGAAFRGHRKMIVDCAQPIHLKRAHKTSTEAIL